MFPVPRPKATIVFRMIHAEWATHQISKGHRTEQGSEEVPKKRSSRAMMTPRGTMSSLSPRTRRAKTRSQAHHRHGEVCRSGRNRQRDFEKPYHQTQADEANVVLRDALAKSKKLESVNSSCMVESTWSASPRTRKQSTAVDPLATRTRSYESPNPTSTRSHQVDDSAVKLVVDLV